MYINHIYNIHTIYISYIYIYVFMGCYFVFTSSRWISLFGQFLYGTELFFLPGGHWRVFFHAEQMGVSENGVPLNHPF